MGNATGYEQNLIALVLDDVKELCEIAYPCDICAIRRKCAEMQDQAAQRNARLVVGCGDLKKWETLQDSALSKLGLLRKLQTEEQRK